MKTAPYILAMAAAAGLAGFAVPASAATMISGIISNVTAHSSGDGLLIDSTPIAFGPLVLNNPGDVAVANVLTIGTPEGSVEPFIFGSPEDDVAKLISVTFNFANPVGVFGGGPLTGTTTGFYQLFTHCGAVAGGCGRVTWSGPMDFDFGNGGKFSVSLTDAVFDTDGAAHWGDATVQGKFKLLSASTPAVPEPSTWAMMIIGFGLVGGLMRRRQQAVRYNFA